MLPVRAHRPPGAWPGTLSSTPAVVPRRPRGTQKKAEAAFPRFGSVARSATDKKRRMKQPVRALHPPRKPRSRGERAKPNRRPGGEEAVRREIISSGQDSRAGYWSVLDRIRPPNRANWATWGVAVYALARLDSWPSYSEIFTKMSVRTVRTVRTVRIARRLFSIQPERDPAPSPVPTSSLASCGAVRWLPPHSFFVPRARPPEAAQATA